MVEGSPPISIISHARRIGLKDELRTFLFLKYEFDIIGSFKLEGKLTKRLCGELQLSEATFFRHLNKLRLVNYIGKAKNKVHYIRGYGALIEQNKLSKTRTVELRQEHLINKDHFRSYVVCALAGSESYNFGIDLRRGELDKEGLYQPRQGSKILRKQRNYACPLSTRFMENVTGLKRSSNSKLISKGVGLGYIYRERDLEFINLPISEIASLRTEWEIGEPFPVIHKGHIWLRHPNKFLAKLTYKRRRNYK